MSRFVSIAAVLFLLAAPASANAAARFFSLIEDLPIAPGLAETQSQASLVSDRGDLVIEVAEGAAGAEAVRGFYAETLPALGWSLSPGAPAGQTLFQRGREQLTLTYKPLANGRLRLEVRLVTRPASMRAD